MRVVSAGPSRARLVFSIPVPGRVREKLLVNRRLEASTKMELAPSKDGKPASLSITFMGGAGLERYTLRVKTDAQAQAIVDAARAVQRQLDLLLSRTQDWFACKVHS